MRRAVYAFLISCITLISCNSGLEVKDNLSKQSFSLLNQDSAAVVFPDDFKGEISVITFIYTHCPDVCPVITANLTNIQRDLQDTSNIRFIEISFDPERDNPSVLKKYKDLYKLNDQFSLLTGNPSTVDSLLDRLDIVAEKTQLDSLQQDSNQYFMKHSNKIYLIDGHSRIRAEYPASVVPPKNVIEDIRKLR